MTTQFNVIETCFLRSSNDEAIPKKVQSNKAGKTSGKKDMSLSNLLATNKSFKGKGALKNSKAFKKTQSAISESAVVDTNITNKYVLKSSQDLNKGTSRVKKSVLKKNTFNCSKSVSVSKEVNNNLRECL